MVHRDMREAMWGVTLAVPHQLTPLCLAEISLYNESLDILALCLVKEYNYQDAAIAVAKELLKHKDSLSVGKGTLHPCRAPSALRGISGALAVRLGSHRDRGHGSTGAGVHLQPHRQAASDP